MQEDPICMFCVKCYMNINFIQLNKEGQSPKSGTMSKNTFYMSEFKMNPRQPSSRHQGGALFPTQLLHRGYSADSLPSPTQKFNYSEDVKSDQSIAWKKEGGG